MSLSLSESSLKLNQKKAFLCWTLNSGTSFYRMMNPAKYMRDRISFGLSKWTPDFQGVAEWEFKIKDPQVGRDLHVLITECDITISQKFHDVGGLALMDTYRHQFPNKPWFTDVDDHVFDINPNSPAYENYQPGSALEGIIKEQMRLSTGLIVSTDYLRKVYEPLNPNIWVIPNGIDFEVWDALTDKPKRSKKLRIGWAGGGSHVDDLEFIYPAVDRIRKKYTNVEFVFLGGFPPCYRNVNKIKAIRKWYPINEYPQAVKNLKLDIALAPLRDSEFNRGKSNLRWLEYSALKIPTVASNVEAFRCIESGKDGILVTELDEWEFALEALIESESMRKEIGSNAYERVQRDFNVKTIADTYVNAIHKMINGKTNISRNFVIDSISGNE